MRKVVDGVDPLGEKVEDLRRTLHPLSRMSYRRRRDRPATEEEAEAEQGP